MQKITPQNYNKLSSTIPFSKMPRALADTHGEMPMYLEFYGQDKEITEVVDLYLSKVNQIINRPVVRTVYKDRVVYKDKIIYKDKIVKEPCDILQEEEKSYIEKLKNPLVIGGFVTGVIIGKML